ncbi:MAG: cytochrome c [Pseudomonadales bacterium]|nr:cytochrome c [Pseudomonadales bacterium]
MKKKSFISRLFLPTAIGLLVLIPSNTVFAHAYGEWRDAEQIYASTCHYCHDTGVAPVLFGRALSPQFIILRARNGFNAMPAFKPSEISVTDLEILARWIQQREAPKGSVAK